MVEKVAINAKQIAALAGKEKVRTYAANLMKDPTFPRPIIEQKGGAGLSWWYQHEVIAYFAKKADRPKAVTGRAAALTTARQDTLDLGLAQLFIRTCRLG